MFVDCHTHLLPDRLATAIRRFFAGHGVADFAYALDHHSVLDRHHADGIDTVWNLPYAHKAGIASGLNESMLEVTAALADHQVAVVPGCTVHPADDDAVGDFHTAVDAGARVLKLHCSVGDYAPDEPRLGPVLDAAGERGVPVVIHAGHGIDGFTGSDELAPVANALERHRHTTIILAHFGHHAFDEAVALFDHHPNLVADLTPVIDSPVPITAALADRYADRILFGSDAPNTGHDAGVLIERLRATGASDETLDAVLFGNARGLIA